jgi:hypothetical protein
MSLSPGAEIACTALSAFALSTFCANAQILTFDQAKQRADRRDAFVQTVVVLLRGKGCQPKDEQRGLALQSASISEAPWERT